MEPVRFLPGVCVFLSLVFLHSFNQNVQAKVEFCLGGKHELSSELKAKTSPDGKWNSSLLELGKSGKHQQDWQQQQRQLKIVGCPSGIIFHRPFQLDSVISDDEPFCYKESICEEKWTCNLRKNSIVAEILKVGKPGKNESWTYADGDRFLYNTIESPKCPSSTIANQPPPDPAKFYVHHSMHKLKSRNKRAITGLVPTEPISVEQIQREVNDQTKRLFYYLTGVNQEPVNSHLRVVKLFKMSIQLVSMICDPQYVTQKFLRQIERSFLFLLKEQGFDKMVDLDLESYNQLKETLEHCASTVKMVKYMGRPCPTGLKIDKVHVVENGRIKSISYKRSHKTFKWGEYDIIMDAAWSAMSVVHAGCFDAFSAKVNLLHKYEVALEQLFHSALYLRWEHPTPLADDLFYDNMLMAKVNDTMMALDACTRITYLFTPLRVQLNRPIHETVYRRRKRSIVDSSTNLSKFPGVLAEKLSDSLEEDVFGNGESHKMPAFNCLKTDTERRVTVAKRKFRDCN